MNVEGKYIWNPDHDLELGPEFHQTDRGWSDVEPGQSAGERSVLEARDESSKSVFWQVENNL